MGGALVRFSQGFIRPRVSNYPTDILEQKRLADRGEDYASVTLQFVRGF